MRAMGWTTMIHPINKGKVSGTGKREILNDLVHLSNLFEEMLKMKCSVVQFAQKRYLETSKMDRDFFE